MPQFSMVQIAALAIAAGVTAAVIGLAMALAQAKVKMLVELTGKAMAQKIIGHRELKAAAAVDALASRAADDMDGDIARQSFADAARDAGMTAEEAQQQWWETESARSFKSTTQTDWHDYYINDSRNNGLSYEEAIEWVDKQEAMIDSALGYLRDGLDLDAAIERAREEHRS